MSLWAGVVALLGKVFSFVDALFTARNTPEMKTSKTAQQETDAQSAVEKAVAKKDTDALRKELAE